ncbi:MAG TPA: Uma2 family endonuclease [Thermoanaerobaculia bacterium]|nr:Uma2 family endonuclease [Thermoanaerobaculia bacterium]
MAVSVRKRLLTIDEYHQMVESGILAEGERVELIYGEILEMNPIGHRHATCLRRLIRLFGPGVVSDSVAPDVLLDVQNPLRLPNEQSEPQPDLMLLRGRDDCYASKPPAAEDVLLLVEIADHSLAYDRDVKLPLYAQAGIPEVWLVDLTSDTIRVHRRPSPEGYLEARQAGRGEAIAPQALPRLLVRVELVLG